MVQFADHVAFRLPNVCIHVSYLLESIQFINAPLQEVISLVLNNISPSSKVSYFKGFPSYVLSMIFSP